MLFACLLPYPFPHTKTKGTQTKNANARGGPSRRCRPARGWQTPVHVCMYLYCWHLFVFIFVKGEGERVVSAGFWCVVWRTHPHQRQDVGQVPEGGLLAIAPVAAVASAALGRHECAGVDGAVGVLVGGGRSNLVVVVVALAAAGGARAPLPLLLLGLGACDEPQAVVAQVQVGVERRGRLVAAASAADAVVVMVGGGFGWMS